MRAPAAVSLEAMLVATLGLACALAANALSSRGLKLSRDYFPPGPNSNAQVTPSSPTHSTDRGGTTATNGAAAAATGSAPGPEDAAQHLRQRGLQPVSGNEVIELFRDPRREQGLIVFVDARDDGHFAGGHIPGARQLDRFRPENYMPTVLPACLTALKVIIYCSGGECEDSAFAAILLGDAGVPRENLFVYAGGITEWKAQGHPVETGARP